MKNLSNCRSTVDLTSDRLGLGRRSFLSWCLGAAAAGGSASSLLSLSACGGSAGESMREAAFADLAVLAEPSSVRISIQARRVEWVPGRTAEFDNAWVYVPEAAGSAKVLPNHLGPTFNVRRNSACTVTWQNDIPGDAQQPGTLALPPINVRVSPAICGNVQTQSAVGLVTHLHGARVAAGSDGWPLSPIGYLGNPYGFPVSQQYTYPNAQRSTMLWYHDHALDRTGRHVHAGLAGVYFIRDSADDAVLSLLGGAAQEVPCVLQDRILTAQGSRIDYAAGMPDVDPLERPEFLGSQIFMNGHPTPSVVVDRLQQRLRILNGSNARTYALALCDPDAVLAKRGQVWHSQCLRLIGADGGLISKSVALEALDVLVIAPGQRRDVLLDISAIAGSVARLCLVNLSLEYFLDMDSKTPEAIFTTQEDSVLAATSLEYTAADQRIYEALGNPLAQLMQMGLAVANAPNPSANAAAIDQILVAAATEDDFVWDGTQLGPRPDAAWGPNRLVLLMSNTEDLDTDETVNGIGAWGDVQIFEMVADGNDWTLPFDVDLSSASNPAPGEPAATKNYGLARRSFFAQERNPDVTVAKAYPPLHAPTIKAKAGTYERWYVANIGNSQPLNGAEPPDMHPFHIHLVNFVVTRRWALDDAKPGNFVPLPSSDLNLDRIARQDTVMVPSNQMVELLVHFPAGFGGDYVYHCHLLEHEDMCMMSHFHVDA